jgi:hypothetical protein
MFFVRSLRESWVRVLKVMWNSMLIIFIILGFVCFFALLGFVFLSNCINDEVGYFKTINNSFMNTYVLFTTSNYPDIFIPFWLESNWYLFYFFIFLFVGQYMILNLVLAVFYNNYKNEMESKI